MSSSIFFRIDSLYTEIISCSDPQFLQIINDACSIQIISYRKRKGQFHPEKRTRTVTYYRNKQFPSGLLPRIYYTLQSNVENIYIEDVRVKPKLHSVEYNLVSPTPLKNADYSFQDIAVERALKYSRGLLHYPTGSGKTVIMAKVIKELGVHSLVIVPNLQLLAQTYSKFCDYFGDRFVGKYNAVDKTGFKFPIVVATQQSLYSLSKNDPSKFYEFTKDLHALLIDECHHVAVGSEWKKNKQGKWQRSIQNTWWEVAMKIPAYYRFGVSATLGQDNRRVDQFILESVTGRIISSISVSDLISRGVLCPIDVTMYRVPGVKCSIWKSDKKSGKQGAYETNIIDNRERNRIIVHEALKYQKEGKKVLILVDLVDKHGAVLHDMLPESIFLHGSCSTEERQRGIEEVRSNNKILIGTIFGEGFDMPSLDVLIIANGGKSGRNLLQKIGRVLRVAPGKDRAKVIDFYDEDGSMCEKHSKNRLRIYSKEVEYSVEVKSYE